jgi:hypothetical protein
MARALPRLALTGYWGPGRHQPYCGLPRLAMTTIASPSVLKPQSGAIGPKVYSLLAHIALKKQQLVALNRCGPARAEPRQPASCCADDEPLAEAPPGASPSACFRAGNAARHAPVSPTHRPFVS